MHTSPQMKQTNQDSGSLAGSLAADGHQGRNRNQTDGEIQQTSKKPRGREGAGVDLELKRRNARGDEGNQQIGKGIRELGERGKKDMAERRTPPRGGHRRLAHKEGEDEARPRRRRARESRRRRRKTTPPTEGTLGSAVSNFCLYQNVSNQLVEKRESGKNRGGTRRKRNIITRSA